MIEKWNDAVVKEIQKAQACGDIDWVRALIRLLI